MQKGICSALPRQANHFSISLYANQPLVHCVDRQQVSGGLPRASKVEKQNCIYINYNFIIYSLVLKTLSFNPIQIMYCIDPGISCVFSHCCIKNKGCVQRSWAASLERVLIRDQTLVLFINWVCLTISELLKLWGCYLDILGYFCFRVLHVRLRMCQCVIAIVAKGSKHAKGIN